MHINKGQYQMKIITFYLPQFHNIPENNEWWGEGFTEWSNVKKAKPLYDGHAQPRVPLNDNYYNLLDDEVKKWQVKIAKDHGIYGFAYYHYWFNGRMLLEKPMEQMLANKEIDMPFCISWANETWTKAWVGNERQVLILQKYGEKKEWVEHFNYLLQFFKDDRYIKINGKPLFIIYRPEVIECLNDMLDCWNEEAKKNGIPGLAFAYQSNEFNNITNKDDSRFDFDIEFQPNLAVHDLNKEKHTFIRKLKRKVSRIIESKFGIEIDRFTSDLSNKIMHYNRIDYDLVWKEIIKRKPTSVKSIPGAFVGWDNTPRYGERASVYVGDTPDKLYYYMDKQIKNARDNYKSEYIFMYAWNEWAEGGYLEPDTRFGFGNLDAIKKALSDNDEFPW